MLSPAANATQKDWRARLRAINAKQKDLGARLRAINATQKDLRARLRAINERQKALRVKLGALNEKQKDLRRFPKLQFGNRALKTPALIDLTGKREFPRSGNQAGAWLPVEPSGARLGMGNSPDVQALAVMCIMLRIH
ncbi:hypothetical protein A1355_23290 [Methylomonas koyamae]|uniref:Uncharacterized protein n=1 Tax=Methylomonas koyamae TaxID=702114 RepID=A0A177NU79_9GAMM|nr:hypothetical protein A1355_23290 [Methylomonas koyamae]